MDQEESLTEDVRRTMGVMAPWATSFLFHLGLVVLALLLVWMVYEPGPDEETLIGVSEKQTTVVNYESTSDSESTEPSGGETAVDPMALEIDDPLPISKEPALNIGGKRATPTGGPYIGDPSAQGSGLFGVGDGPDTGGPPGAPGNKIIFLIDASGSLVDSMPHVLQELKRSVQSMPAGKDFNVIFFENGQPREIPVPSLGWKKSGPGTAKQMLDWLDAGHITPRGKTDPRRAIQLALNYQPRVLVILSDNITGAGRHEINRDQLLGFFESTPGPKPVVHTIQFLATDQARTLAQLATRYGGSHKFIDERDLGKIR